LETYYNSEIHTCKLLSGKSYFIPSDFNEHREFFQYTAYGQEQLFSIYQGLFNEQMLPEYDDHFDWNFNRGIIRQKRIAKFIQTTLPKVIRKLRKIVFKDIVIGLFYLQPKKKIRVGIMGSFFYSKFYNTLIIKSKGIIFPIRPKTRFETASEINFEKRNLLSLMDSGFDKFDRFFFTSFNYCFPKEFIEDFSIIESYYLGYFSKYKNLKYIVSEQWIGDTNTATAIAILKIKGVKHIYNEHNFLSQQFLGHSNKYLMSMADSFVTLGWYEEGIPNLVKGASLFEFSVEKKHKKKYDIFTSVRLRTVKSNVIY
jgi:putative transferase (TIGR04331 family)